MNIAVDSEEIREAMEMRKSPPSSFVSLMNDILDKTALDKTRKSRIDIAVSIFIKRR